jgi:hypothetical protein
MKDLNLPTNKDIIRNKPYASGYKIKKVDISKEKLYELYYEQKLSLQKIGKLYGKDREDIHRRMKKYGFKSRTRSDAWKHRGTKDVYKINEDFFHIWSKEMAYILGFILTDGCVHKISRRIIIAVKDLEILQKIKKIMNAGQPIRFCQSKKLYEFGFCREKISDRLQELGIIQNKSLSVKFPNVPEKYLSHFIRGVFDGDGTVFFEPRSNTSPLRVSFVSGSKEFITSLESKLHSNAGLLKRTIYERLQKRMSYYIRYGHKDSLKFFDYIYAEADESVRLERKYQKFLEGMETEKKQLEDSKKEGKGL